MSITERSLNHLGPMHVTPFNVRRYMSETWLIVIMEANVSDVAGQKVPGHISISNNLSVCQEYWLVMFCSGTF